MLRVMNSIGGGTLSSGRSCKVMISGRAAAASNSSSKGAAMVHHRQSSLAAGAAAISVYDGASI